MTQMCDVKMFLYFGLLSIREQQVLLINESPTAIHQHTEKDVLYEDRGTESTVLGLRDEWRRWYFTAVDNDTSMHTASMPRLKIALDLL